MGKGKSIIEKIWDLHVVQKIENDVDVLYIDQSYLHEVTSPQAFEGIENRGLKVFRPKKNLATTDHVIPTLKQNLPLSDSVANFQVKTLIKNCRKHSIRCFSLGHKLNGIVHVIGPELGITQPGMTVVCGDSHTSTHGALGALAFGIGTFQVEMVLASQCLIMNKPKMMRITVEGELKKGVTSKDVIMYIIGKIGTGGGTGYFVEFAGSTIKNMSVEARMTLCNMSIEMGSRGGIVAPDEKTYEYLKNKQFSPIGKEYEWAVKRWRNLYTDENAEFDKEYFFKVSEINPMITFGTNPEMSIQINETIPVRIKSQTFKKALNYMGFSPGEKLLGKPIDYVFLGSCTNGRIEDFRMFAEVVKNRKKSKNVTAWLVPGSNLVKKQIKEEGIDKVLRRAGFTIRQPGCSACLSMNDDKIEDGKYCIATINRNFEGRQGVGARTILASPYLAAVAAITGKISDVNEYL